MRQRTRNTHRRAQILTVALVGVLCVVLTACEASAPMPVPTATPSATVAPHGDGVLTLGTLFATTGPTASVAKAQIAGVELAVREINEAGGVNGKPVVVYHKDSGDVSTEKPVESFADLVSKNVDVVIGPSSATLAERILPEAISAGVAIISPSVTSPTLTSLADDGLLFRTVPSVSLEGRALAEAIGKSRVAVVYYSDDAGRAVRDELALELEQRGGEVVAREGFSVTANDAVKIVAILKTAKPDVVVLISPMSAAEKNEAILLALSRAELGGAKLWLTSQNLADYSQSLPEGVLLGVKGIRQGAAADAGFLERVKSADPSISGFHYAAEAYDAAVLAALAAIVALNDSGVAVARALQDVSTGGITCTSFGECLEVLKTRTDIDYDGISGPIDLDEAGDPQRATFGLYRFTKDNTFESTGSLLVSEN